jgi:transposase-like protein
MTVAIAGSDLSAAWIPVRNIELCVRWHLTYRVSYRDLVEMLAERGVNVSHTTIYRGVQRHIPEFERCHAPYTKSVDPSWMSPLERRLLPI